MIENSLNRKFERERAMDGEIQRENLLAENFDLHHVNRNNHGIVFKYCLIECTESKHRIRRNERTMGYDNLLSTNKTKQSLPIHSIRAREMSCAVNNSFKKHPTFTHIRVFNKSHQIAKHGILEKW